VKFVRPILARFNVLSGLTPNEAKLLITLGPGSFVMASTIGTINIGLPAVQDEFDVSLSALKWVSIIGAIMMASLSLCFGRIADNVGRRRIYKLGFILYAVFSGLAAVSVSFPTLMAARVVTAMGVAMSLPLGVAIAASSARPERRGQVIGLLASFTAAGQLAGPSLGGFALDLYGWRGIFLANLIVAGICSVIQHFTLTGRDERRSEPFDFVGAVLLFLGYPALLIALSLGPGEGWDAPLTLAWFAFAAVGIAAFVIWELRTPTPLFRFAMFRSLTFSVAMFTLVVASFVQSPVTLFTPIYMQRALEVAPVTVGIIMMALPLSTLVAGPVGGRLADRHDPRLVAAAGAFITFLAVLAYSRLGITTPALWVIVPLVLLGVGGGFFRPANQVSVFAGVNPREYGSLSAMLQSMGALSSTMGATITVALNERHGGTSDGAAFAEAQQTTFTYLLPLVLLAVFVSFLGRARPKAQPSLPAESAGLEEEPASVPTR
jgi:MFS family permease